MAALQQLQEALALPEEPATLAPKQGRRDLKMLLPIAARLTELTVEAEALEVVEEAYFYPSHQ